MTFKFRNIVLCSTLTLALSGCVNTKPVVDYTPEQLEVLQVMLEGESSIKSGTYSDNVNDLVWTCFREFPVRLAVDVQNMKAKLKLQVDGRYVRSEGRLNHLGEITTVANVTTYDEGTRVHSFKTEIQLRQQRARITLGRGSSSLSGCPSGWFDLALVK